MTDDPRDIIRAAGVECAEVDEWAANEERFIGDSECETNAEAVAAILALARLVAKYKWQRDECADELGRKLAADYEYEATKPFAASDVIVDLERRWDEHCK